MLFFSCNSLPHLHWMHFQICRILLFLCSVITFGLIQNSIPLCMQEGFYIYSDGKLKKVFSEEMSITLKSPFHTVNIYLAGTIAYFFCFWQPFWDGDKMLFQRIFPLVDVNSAKLRYCNIFCFAIVESNSETILWRKKILLLPQGCNNLRRSK